MKEITFDTYKSYKDFSLILTSKIIGLPEIKTEYVEVLGADGQLDMTEAFGDVKYNNRTLTFEFSLIESIDWEDGYSKVLNYLHGRKMKVIIDDPDYYYLGRISVSDYESSRKIGKITIEVNAEPYKYKQTKTIVTRSVSGTLTVDYYNSRKTVIPTFTTDAAVQITYNGNTYTISGSGTHIIPNIIFKRGFNTLTLTGTVTVAVSYQEGDL